LASGDEISSFSPVDGALIAKVKRHYPADYDKVTPRAQPQQLYTEWAN